VNTPEASRRPAGLALVVLVVLVAGGLVAACAPRENDASGPLPPGTAQSGPGTTPGSTPGSTGTGAPTNPLVADAGGVVPYGAAIRPAVQPAGTTIDKTIRTPDGNERTFHVYVPSTLPKDTRVPLVVALHGGGGNGAQFERQSGFDGLAEANRFIVVYPDGTRVPAIPNGRVWNGGGCCGPAQAGRDNVDDVTFISMVISDVEAQFAIDTTQVFATGHSNGGIMSFRLACELSDVISAIAVQAGTLFVDPCRPVKPVSILQIHGSADTNMPFDGGVGETGISGEDFPPPLQGLETLGVANGCPTSFATTTDPTNPDVSAQVWQPCDENTLMVRVRVEGASHAWMGHPTALPKAMVGEAYMDFDSSAAAWSFLAAHPRSA